MISLRVWYWIKRILRFFLFNLTFLSSSQFNIFVIHLSTFRTLPSTKHKQLQSEVSCLTSTQFILKHILRQFITSQIFHWINTIIRKIFLPLYWPQLRENTHFHLTEIPFLCCHSMTCNSVIENLGKLLLNSWFFTCFLLLALVVYYCCFSFLYCFHEMYILEWINDVI